MNIKEELAEISRLSDDLKSADPIAKATLAGKLGGLMQLPSVESIDVPADALEPLDQLGRKLAVAGLAFFLLSALEE